MHPQLLLAIHAAKGFKMGGRFAASQFAKRNSVHPKFVRIARQLEAVKGV